MFESVKEFHFLQLMLAPVVPFLLEAKNSLSPKPVESVNILAQLLLLYYIKR